MEVPLGKAVYLLSPRITLLVTSFSREGKPNAAPFTWAGCVSYSPPMLYIGIGRENKGTLANMRETGRFGVNVVSEGWAQKAVDCELKDPGKLEKAGIKVDRSGKVPEAKAFLECRLVEIVDVKGSDHFLIIGEAVRAECGCWDAEKGRPDLDELKPILHMGGKVFRAMGKEIILERKG